MTDLHSKPRYFSGCCITIVSLFCSARSLKATFKVLSILCKVTYPFKKLSPCKLFLILKKSATVLPVSENVFLIPKFFDDLFLP